MQHRHSLLNLVWEAMLPTGDSSTEGAGAAETFVSAKDISSAVKRLEYVLRVSEDAVPWTYYRATTVIQLAMVSLYDCGALNVRVIK